MRTIVSALLLSLALLTPRAAVGDEGSPPEQVTPPAPAPPAAAPAPSTDLTVRPTPELDFVLMDEKLGERPADKALEAAVRRRRTLLQAHQAAGLATWALMGTTAVYGRLNYRDLYLGEGTEKYRSTHKKLGYATASTFAFTGLLAVLAPEPYPKPLRLDTATIHKSAMAVATLGVVTQIVLGVGMRKGLGNLEQRQIANAHQAVGIGTFAAMSVGAITLAF